MTSSAAEANGRRCGPALVLASPGVDDDLLALATTLSGAATGTFGISRHEISSLVAGTTRTALLLLNPDATLTKETRRVVAALTAEGVHWGLLYAVDPVAARFSLLKSLLVPSIPASGRFAVISGAYAAPPGDSAPSSLATVGAPDVRSMLTASHDVLVLNGHANPLDASLGERLVLCARAGHAGQPGGADVFPCFNDHRCFRQRPDGPVRDLVAVAETSANVLVLSGCDLVPVGRSWFRTVAGLAYQAGQTDSVAVIASSEVSVGTLELDLLCIALIAEGRPLGEVVSAVNSARRRHTGPSTGPHGDTGPFVLIGNPGLRVEGFPLASVPCREVVDGGSRRRRLRIELGAVAPPGPEGALVRTRLPEGPQGPHLLVHDRPAGSWCRGICHDDGDGPALYAWVTVPAGSSSTEVALVVEPVASDPLATARHAVAAVLTELPFWSLFLDGYREEMRRRRLATDRIDALLVELPALTRLLATGEVALRHDRATLVDGDSALETCLELWDAINVWQASLLDAAVDVACLVGRMHSYGSPPYLHLAATLEEGGDDCACGEGALTRQVFESPDARIRRVEHLCVVCGGGADEDGRGLVRMGAWPATAELGATLSCECAYRAPDDAQLHVQLVLLVETWMSGRRVVGLPHRDVLSAGTAATVVLYVDVPPDMTEGIHQLSVVAIANGALYLLRRMVQLGEPDAAPGR